MNNKLDELSKALAEGVSRREALRRIGGVLAGTILACIGLGAGAKANPTACNNYCSRFPKGAERSHCTQVCNACPSTTLLCGTSGFSLVCCNGPGSACCSNVCINRATDPHNCGACGHDCGSLPNVISTCNNGTCSYACVNGWANCDGVASNGCETNLNFNSNNCGACGYVCPAQTPVCNGGICQYCDAGKTLCNGFCMAGDVMLCNGTCVDASNDSSNCGSCGNVCNTDIGEVCCNGACIDYCSCYNCVPY